MVGVPGKYKGCETCRRRRVKCSNERPHCRNCVNSGRQCEGYERERVFITGTPENKGRVASHPKRTGSASRSKAKPAGSEVARAPARPQLVAKEPFTSAWDDSVTLSGQGVEAPVLLTALQTSLQSIAEQESDDAAQFNLSLPPYTAPEMHMQAAGDDFNAKARCLVRLGGTDDSYGVTDGYCAFLFEHASTAVAPNTYAGPWEASADQASSVKSMGPENFTTFPNHQYFVRVYRPLAVSLALLRRRGSFLSEQDWTSTPWDGHPKSPLDQLFDIVLRLPPILAMADELMPQQATMTRHLKAQDLLHSCLVLEMQFHEWLRGVTVDAEGRHAAPYWCQEGAGGEIPFASPFAFRDGLSALMMLYYWMAQIPFHRCVESLHAAICQPVIDAYPNMWPDLPPNLQIDPAQYQDGRELAANICLGLDSALAATTQPDMLLGPMTAALDFYRDINATSQDGVLEILWLEAFQKRLAFKGQHIASILQDQQWVEVAKW
ncbi:hypothetical protein CDD83_4135 [Cordyceps sp. RAO-2017]|nr:hypothetical protein CDD83_4135 [Cordyceps sp. RAO-2017]